jgi:hypothetical protein
MVPYEMGATCGAARFFGMIRAAGFEIHDQTYVLHVPRLLAVMASRIVEKRGPDARSRFLRMLAAGECFRNWPTRRYTGYFVAALATKR